PLHLTLFPYTTLFRSHLSEAGQDASSPRGCHLSVHPHREKSGSPDESPLFRQGADLSDYRGAVRARVRPERSVAAQRRAARDCRDRKSTRLNSSHVAI